jgi:hypothetical protein
MESYDGFNSQTLKERLRSEPKKLPRCACSPAYIHNPNTTACTKDTLAEAKSRVTHIEQQLSAQAAEVNTRAR